MMAWTHLEIQLCLYGAYLGREASYFCEIRRNSGAESSRREVPQPLYTSFAMFTYCRFRLVCFDAIDPWPCSPYGQDRSGGRQLRPASL